MKKKHASHARHAHARITYTCMFAECVIACARNLVCAIVWGLMADSAAAPTGSAADSVLGADYAQESVIGLPLGVYDSGISRLLSLCLCYAAPTLELVFSCVFDRVRSHNPVCAFCSGRIRGLFCLRMHAYTHASCTCT